MTEKYDLAAYENRARAVITALMLDQRIGTGPTNPFGKPRIRYAKVRQRPFGSLMMMS